SRVRGFEQPKLLLTGRPGSGKTVLTDYLQQALETAPEVAGRVVRLEFSHPDLGVSLARLGDALGVPETLFEARLVKIGLSTAFAVQADAQAGVARLLLDALKRSPGLVLLLHISQSLAGQDSLAGVPLRLHSDEVPRVTAAEWLWLSLLEPASRYKHLSLLVTMAEAPPRVLRGLGAFAGPLKLAPPTASEAKRFVRSKLPHLRAALQDDIAKQAGRSYEDLRILTLLAEERDPNPQGGLSETAGIVDTMEGRLELLSSLVETAEDPALRDFLRVLAVLSLPEFPNFSSAALKAMGQEGWEGGSALARAFLDAAPGGMGESAEDTLAGAEQWRCFSRRLGRSLRDKLARYDPEGYRGLHLKASRFYEPQAAAQPASEAAARYLQHLFEARSWQDLQRWLARYNARQILIRQVWHAAERELTARFELESVALQVARYYVRLASYHHPEAEAALALLASSEDAEIRAWTQLKRAEGAMYKGRYDVAETLLEPWPQVADPTLTADYELARASVARWRGQLAKAAEHISLRAQPLVNEASGQKRHHELVRAKVALWGGLIAKDQGNLELALRHFGEVESDDGLVQARQAFQKGDVQAKLGLFDTAKAELSRALELARASEAPAT
ncbi:MAG: ATP-binding protein, partial [Deinococcota bacterium]|nr:ATP-binding protein [Deinococcota bacterium]